MKSMFDSNKRRSQPRAARPTDDHVVDKIELVPYLSDTDSAGIGRDRVVTVEWERHWGHCNEFSPRLAPING
ncbi:hypothetical protein GB937_006108 [Aspergillus fischeri]|nr:hypothetical protein GB937_006108 [Aspergillus fischeri]